MPETSVGAAVQCVENKPDVDQAADSAKDVETEVKSISQQQPSRTSSGANEIPVSVARRLYISHFLSTWNSRLFELGAVLFLSALFPGTLLQLSIYALVRNGAAIVFSPAVGSWIDSGNRLNVVGVSIVGQRITVATSCGIFWIMLQRSDMDGSLKVALFALTIILACMEKLFMIMNLVAVERDWVGTIVDYGPGFTHIEA